MDEDKNKNLDPHTEDIGVGMPPELPSHEENKQKLAESLHQEEALPHLRTYHGDIAQFIKNKDQSLSDIALKEHERKLKKRREKKEEDEKAGIVEEEPKKFSALPTNALIYVISLCLLLGALATVAYLLMIRGNQNPVSVSEDRTLLPAVSVTVLDASSISRSDLKETFDSLRNSPDSKNGITAVVISNSATKSPIDTALLIQKTELNLPPSLIRSLESDFMLGLYRDDVSSNFFLILKVKDYGIAFRDMLEWESQMVNDFSFLLKQNATSSNFSFRDLIVKNKDTRAALSASNGSTQRLPLVYTFLDKQTILITESEIALKGLLDSYVAGSTVR